MADEVKRVDYTTKDYEGYKSDMIDLIPQILPEWTDRSESDPGIALLELLAYQLEKLSYYNDRVANESLFSTATQRKSIIDRCRLIGYELAWATSAKFYQVFEIVPQPEDTVIPKGFQVGTVGSDVEEPIIFETVEDLIIPAGMTGLEKNENGEYIYKVLVEQGQTITGEYLGDVVNNEPNQKFYFTYSPVLKDSITVYVDEGYGQILWNRVDDFISSNQDSQDYIAEMDEFDQTFIQFGTGASGKIPSAPARIYADYKVSEGAAGNVGANTITEFYSSLPGLVSTFNPDGPYIKGQDPESIESAKINGPASLKRLDRYVTLSDYESGLLQDYPGLAKVKAINNNGNVDLYVVPQEGDILSAEQKQEILDLVDTKKVMFTIVTVNDPTYVPVDVTVNLVVLPNYDIENIRYAAENAIMELLDKENVDFGMDITMASIHRALLSIEGVVNPVVSAPTGDVIINETEIAKLGTLTVTVNGG